MIRSKTLTAVVVLATLSACVSVPKDDTVSAATARLPDTWRTASEDVSPDIEAWWNGFADAQLRQLIDKALAYNYDLKAAVERTRQAQALITVTRAGLYPDVGATSNASRERTHLPPPVGTNEDSAVSVSGIWNIDIFGGTQLAALAAAAQAAATDEARRDFEVALTANVATSYMHLRGLQSQLDILTRNIAARADTLHLTRVRFEAGLATDLDVAQAETQLRDV